MLRRADFQRVYESGIRIGSPLFTMFALRGPGEAAARVGFTTPRALGKSVVRNRVRRRLREVVRLRYRDLPPGWDVVFNPRRALLNAPLAGIEAEVGRVFRMLVS